MKQICDKQNCNAQYTAVTNEIKAHSTCQWEIIISTRKVMLKEILPTKTSQNKTGTTLTIIIRNLILNPNFKVYFLGMETVKDCEICPSMHLGRLTKNQSGLD